MAEGRCFNVERYCNGIGLHFFGEPEQNCHKSVYSVCEFAILCGQQFNSVKSTVEYAVAVNYHQPHYAFLLSLT